MTPSQMLLRILATKGAMSLEALAEETGMSVPKVRYLIAYQREVGNLALNPHTYSVTPKGSERAKYEPRPRRKGEARAPKPVKLPVPPRMKAEDTVTFAKRSQPALATCWSQQ